MNDLHLIHRANQAGLIFGHAIVLKAIFFSGSLALLSVVSLLTLSHSSVVFAQEQKTVSAATVVSALSPVNINSADAQTLANGLKGIGELRALEIVRYRETYGPFASIEELAEVKGIGKSPLDRNRGVITLE